MNSEYKSIHIRLPIEIYNQVKAILPERGQLTGLLRRFILTYCSVHEFGRNGLKIAIEDALDAAEKGGILKRGDKDGA